MRFERIRRSVAGEQQQVWPRAKTGDKKSGEGNRWVELHRTLYETPARKLTPGTRGGAHAEICCCYSLCRCRLCYACAERRRGTCRLIKASLSLSLSNGKKRSALKGERERRRRDNYSNLKLDHKAVRRERERGTDHPYAAEHMNTVADGWAR